MVTVIHTLYFITALDLVPMIAFFTGFVEGYLWTTFPGTSVQFAGHNTHKIR